jgi:CheY-like chemotaxis protein
MGQALKPIALVVERDENQRALLSLLLEESDMHVVECVSAEAAAAALEHLGDSIVIVFADVNLAGDMTGAELADIAKRNYPGLNVVVTSGSDAPELPADTVFMPKPWRALDVLCMAERSRH